MNDIRDILYKTTLTISCPLELFVWLKKSQRNCSAYIVEAIEARRQQEEETEVQVGQISKQ